MKKVRIFAIVGIFNQDLHITKSCSFEKEILIADIPSKGSLLKFDFNQSKTEADKSWKIDKESNLLEVKNVLFKENSKLPFVQIIFLPYKELNEEKFKDRFDFICSEGDVSIFKENGWIVKESLA